MMISHTHTHRHIMYTHTWIMCSISRYLFFHRVLFQVYLDSKTTIFLLLTNLAQSNCHHVATFQKIFVLFKFHQSAKVNLIKINTYL